MIMRQRRNTPRKELLCRLSVENYDFVCRISRAEEVSIADVLNFMLDQKRQSGITSCNSLNPRSNMSKTCQMTTRLSATQL
jgi:hypothetical protein